MTTVTTSYWPADTSLPVRETTVGGCCGPRRPPGPEMLAMVGGLPDPAVRGRWTYAQLLAEAEQTARALTARFHPGEPVAVWAPNLPEWMILEYGAAVPDMSVPRVTPRHEHELVHTGNRSQLGRRPHDPCPWRRPLIATAARSSRC